MASIFAKAAEVYGVIGKLKRLVEIPGSPTPPTTLTVAALADVSERFNLWAQNIGALRQPASKLSLDSRLQGAPEIRDWVCELLEDLMNALNDREPGKRTVSAPMV
jgi:hypothetical protein